MTVSPRPAPPRDDTLRSGHGLARAAVTGVVWQGLSYLSTKVLALATTVLLAHLLAPEAFGLVTFSIVFVTYAEVVTELGVAQALIYLPRDRRYQQGALLICLAMAVGMATGVALGAPLIGRFFDRPDIVPMIRVLALYLLVSGSFQVPDALLRRGLHFRRRMAVEISRALAYGVVAVALALAGRGAWAIVWAYLAGGVAASTVAWSLVDERPSLRSWRLHRPVARSLLVYGLPVAGHGFLASLIFDIDYVIVGKRLGAEALGFYMLAFRIPELVIINVFYVLSAVAFPAYSHARQDPDRLRRGYLFSTQLQTLYGVGAGVGLAMLAPLLVPVIFGARWSASVAPLQALALYAAFRSLGNSSTDLNKGTGRPGLALKLAVLRLAVLVPVLLWAASFGINAVAWAQAGAAFALALLMQAVTARTIHVPLRDFAVALRPAVAAGAGIAVGAGLVRWWLPGGVLVRLAVAVVAAAALGFAAVWAVDRPLVGEIRGLLRRPATAPAGP
jgi:PST family polysaccharide transporter